jgi:hypothetical protein
MDPQVSILGDLAAERKCRASIEITQASGLDLDQFPSKHPELLWIDRLLF